MESHGAKSSFRVEVEGIPVQRDQLVLHSAFHVGVDVTQLTPLASTGTLSLDSGPYQRS
jgi:hypothetical protein